MLGRLPRYSTDKLPVFGSRQLFDSINSPSDRIVNTVQRNKVVAMISIILFTVFLIFSMSGSSTQSITKTYGLNYFPRKFRIATVADLDHDSKVEGGKKWKSIYLTGTLTRTDDDYFIEWDEPVDIYTPMNEAGRGAELSDLALWRNQLYTVDDRTGIMFTIKNFQNKDPRNPPELIPMHIFMEGPGNINGKGMKFEWATVKDDVLYAGSFGKEYTNNNGEILHDNNLWIVTVDRNGREAHFNWKTYYDHIREVTGTSHPGYMIHETVVWSHVHRQWYVLPRRVSNQPYNDESDEKRGSNIVLVSSEDMSTTLKYTIGTITPERGFSSAKFLPGSGDNVMIALKSEENAKLGTQNTYITIFGGSDSPSQWKIFMPETSLPFNAKFEGIEIIDFE